MYVIDYECVFLIKINVNGRKMFKIVISGCTKR